MPIKIEAKSEQTALTREQLHDALVKWRKQWNALSSQEQANELARTAGPVVKPDMKLFTSALPPMQSTAGGTDDE